MKIKATPRRVNFAQYASDFNVALYGALGLSTIAIALKTGLTPCQVVYRLNKAQIKRADYRNADPSGYAAIVLNHASQAVSDKLRKALA